MPELISIVDVTNQKGNTEHLATVRVLVRLVDGDSGESVELYGIGSGQDAGDKAVMKAQTAAIKYAYMMSLCIATGDDPEADRNTDENTGSTKQKTNNKGVSGKLAASKEAVAVCVGCGDSITSQRVLEYSINKFNQPLCMDCQKRVGQAA